MIILKLLFRWLLGRWYIAEEFPEVPLAHAQRACDMLNFADFWDEWRGGTADQPVMLVARMLKIGGLRVDLHKMMLPDAANCFHTHPAWAIRIVLWGGYIEEILDPALFSYYRRWFPRRVGIIAPRFCHRIDHIMNHRASYSLWLRGPVVANVKLVGSGWSAADLGEHPERN